MRTGAPGPAPPQTVPCAACGREVRPLHDGGGGHGWFHRELARRGRMFLSDPSAPTVQVRCPRGHPLEPEVEFLAASVYPLYRELRRGPSST